MKIIRCKFCNTLNHVEDNGDVVYSGGTMHMSCWWCGSKLEKDEMDTKEIESKAKEIVTDVRKTVSVPDYLVNWLVTTLVEFGHECYTEGYKDNGKVAESG
jgi:hypothetical protein